MPRRPFDSLAVDPRTPWVVGERGRAAADAPEIAWPELARALTAGSQPALVLDALGLAGDELVARVRALVPYLQPTGQLLVAHADQAALVHAVRELFADGWLARAIDGGTHRSFLFARGSTTITAEAYVELLLRQALLSGQPRAHDRGGGVRLSPGIHALLDAETTSPAFAWMVDRALGGAHLLARIGNARGVRGRASLAASLLSRSLRGSAAQLAKAARTRLRKLRPRQVPPAVAAARERLLAAAAEVPTSDGSRYYQRLPLRIGVVTDEFLFHALEDAAELVVVTPTNYQALDVDLFLFVACSNGLGHWPKVNVDRSPARRALLQVIDHLNLRGVPTVFWSIEDPPHYDDFISVAQRSTHVYTTTAEKVDDYRRDCANSQVGVLPFGVNPLVHNPIGGGAAGRAALFFAGTWYQQYPERELDMANLFDGAGRAGRELVLVDRCYLRGNPGFDFPPEYRPFTWPPIDHEPLQQVQKLFDWCLNFNSVKHSATMLANRVPELQAQGRAVLSNYSLSVDRMYPQVFTVTDAAEVAPILGALSADELREHQMLGVRAVMEDQTYFEKVAQLGSDVGLPVTLPARKLLVVADRITDRVRATFAAQVLSEPRALVAADELTPAAWAAHDFVAWWPADAAYGPFHLQDQLHAFKYTRARWVACGEPAHQFTRALADQRGAMFATAAVGLDELKGELRGDVAGGYLVPAIAVRAGERGARPAARLTVVVAHRDQAARVWCKHLLPARGQPAVDVLVLDDASITAESRAWQGRMAVEPGVRVASLPPGPGSRTARAWRAAAAMVATPYLLVCDVDDGLIHGALPALAALLAEDHDAIGAAAIDLTAPSTRSRSDAPTVLRTSGPEALAAHGFVGPPLSALVVARRLALAAGDDPDRPLFTAALLAGAARAATTSVRLVGRHRSSDEPLAALRVRLAAAAACEADRLALYDRHGLTDRYLRERFLDQFRAAYLAPLGRLRADEQPAARAGVRAAFARYQPRLAAVRWSRPDARELATWSASLTDPP